MCVCVCVCVCLCICVYLCVFGVYVCVCMCVCVCLFEYHDGGLCKWLLAMVKMSDHPGSDCAQAMLLAQNAMHQGLQIWARGLRNITRYGKHENTKMISPSGSGFAELGDNMAGSKPMA